MAVWFQGENRIACDLAQLEQALDDPGELYLGVTGLMPGMTSVELVDRDKIL